MSLLLVIGEAIDIVASVLSATRRMQRADRRMQVDNTSAPLVPGPPSPLIPSPPPPLGSGYPEALAYIRGRDAVVFAAEHRKRLLQQAAEFARASMGDPAGNDSEPEAPTGGKS